jgi:hypothetical protein
MDRVRISQENNRQRISLDRHRWLPFEFNGSELRERERNAVVCPLYKRAFGKNIGLSNWLPPVGGILRSHCLRRWRVT